MEYALNEIIQAAQDFKQKSCPCCQYLLKDEVSKALLTYQDKHLSGRKSNSHRLYDNMVLLGLTEDIRIKEGLQYHYEENGFVRSHTHHIIPVRCKCVKRFEEKGISFHINDGRNGIILPANEKTEISFANGTIHSTLHTDKYRAMINTIVEQVSIEDELWEKLDLVKKALYEDDLPN